MVGTSTDKVLLDFMGFFVTTGAKSSTLKAITNFYELLSGKLVIFLADFSKKHRI